MSLIRRVLLAGKSLTPPNPNNRAETSRRHRESAMKRLHRREVLILGLILGAAASLVACNKGPGAGTRWTNYPSLASSTTSYRWLVVKCQLSDVSKIPAGLDTNIEQFFGISGAGYGNMVDYFHDVSYNHASVISDTFVGWVRAPFGTSDLSCKADARGRLCSNRAQRVKECLEAIPADQLPDLDNYYGVVAINNVVQDGGAAGVGQLSMTVRDQKHNLGVVWFDPNSLSTEFAMHEISHGLGLDHSFDDSQRNCGGRLGEYCDPWDIMSAQADISICTSQTFWWRESFWRRARHGNSPGLLRMGWIPWAESTAFSERGR